MKCYQCGHDVESEAIYCRFCGALFKPTEALMEAVAHHDEKAIIMLYQMSYNQIYNELISLGLPENECQKLINVIFKSYVKDIVSLGKERESLNALVDHIGFSYMKSHGLTPHDVKHEEVWKEVTSDQIEEMLKTLQKPKRPLFKKVLIGGLAALLVIGGLFGHEVMQEKEATVTKTVKKKTLDKDEAAFQKEAYTSLVREYVCGVNKAKVDSYYAKPEKLEKECPNAKQIVSIALKHKKSLKDLQCMTYDVNGDGLKELVTGYKGKKGTFVITGIYVNDGSDEYVTNTNVLTKDSDKILFTKDHQVIRKSGSFDHVLTLDHENHYQVRRSLKDLLAFFQKKKIKTVSLQAKCAMSFYEKETGIPLPAYQKSQSRTMTKWLKAFRTGHVSSCDQIAKTMPKYTEELSSLKMSSGMRNAYLEVVKEYRGKRFVIGGGNLGAYYLSDLDGDGKVELIIEDFDCDCPSVLNIYKYQNKKAKEVVSGYEYAAYVNKNGPPFGSPSEDELSFYAYENHPGMICYERHDGKEQVSILKLSGHKLKKIKYSSHPCRKVKGKAHFTNLGMQLDGHGSGEDSFDYSLLGFIPQPVPEGTIVEDWY